MMKEISKFVLVMVSRLRGGREVHEKVREFFNEITESRDVMTECWVTYTSIDAAAIALVSLRPSDKLALNNFCPGSDHISQETEK